MSVPANVDVILQGSAMAEALRQRCVLIFGGTKLCPVPPGGMRTDGKASMATCSQIVSPCVTFATLTTWTVLTGRQRTRLIFRDIQGLCFSVPPGSVLRKCRLSRPAKTIVGAERRVCHMPPEASEFQPQPFGSIWGIYDLLCPLVSCNAHAHTYTFYVIWIVFAFCEVLLS